ncbi:zinc finger MYM-type protein 1-like [Styela clava]
MEKLVEMPSGSGKYLSSTCQNEIIQMISGRLKQTIITENKAAPFFSIILDTTQDISKIDQLSAVYRYIRVVKNEDLPIDGKIKEVFMGFHKVSGQTSHELATQLEYLLHANGLDLLKCRGQGYDGAANMQGAYDGLQAKIAAKQPLAVYVYCAAHNLNLVINDAVNNVREI